ncbi:hypothetical protein ACJX0J_016374, partial [Zea mays]
YSTSTGLMIVILHMQPSGEKIHAFKTGTNSPKNQNSIALPNILTQTGRPMKKIHISLYLLSLYLFV